MYIVIFFKYFMTLWFSLDIIEKNIWYAEGEVKIDTYLNFEVPLTT
jgi:hypothetical protein